MNVYLADPSGRLGISPRSLSCLRFCLITLLFTHSVQLKDGLDWSFDRILNLVSVLTESNQLIDLHEMRACYVSRHAACAAQLSMMACILRTYVISLLARASNLSKPMEIRVPVGNFYLVRWTQQLQLAS